VKFNFLIGILFLTLLSINFIDAAPPVTTVQNFPKGYVVEETQQSALVLNHDFSYHFYLYNSSNGIIISDDEANCTFAMANLYGKIIFSSNATYIESGDYWELNISGDYLNYSGEYSYGVNCQNSQGGALAGTFLVTPDGSLYTENSNILVWALLGLGFIFILFSIYFNTKYWALKAFFQFMAIGSALVAVNTARALSTVSDSIGKMGTVGLTIIIVMFMFFFLWMFVFAFIEIIKAFKNKKGVRWNYD